MWRREAVARATHRPATGPRDVDVDAAGEELDGRRRIRIPDQRIGFLVAPDRHHRGESPRVALDRHVVRGGDEQRPAEIRAVGELVERLGEALLRGGEAQVDDVEALLDSVAQPGEDQLPAALRSGAEDADTVQRALRRDRADDPGAGGSVPADIADLVGHDRDLALVAALDRDGAVER